MKNLKHESRETILLFDVVQTKSNVIRSNSIYQTLMSIQPLQNLIHGIVAQQIVEYSVETKLRCTACGDQYSLIAPSKWTKQYLYFKEQKPNAKIYYIGRDQIYILEQQDDDGYEYQLVCRDCWFNVLIMPEFYSAITSQ